MLGAYQNLKAAEDLLNNGKFEAAAEEFFKAAEVRPTDSVAWYGLGRSRAALAGQSYRLLLARASFDSPYVLAVKADALMHHDQFRRAFPLLKRALEHDPDLTSARAALAEIYKSDGHPEWAEREEAALRKIDCDKHPLACEAMAGRYAAILSATAGQQTFEALYWRGEAYTSLSYQAFAKLLDLPPSPEFYRFRAGIQYEAGHASRVVTELRKALQLAPADRGLQTELAMALGAARDYPAAYELGTKLLHLEPSSPELNELIGDVLLNEQKAAEAIPYLEKSAKLKPRNLMTKSSLGRAYMQVGETRRAIPNLEAARSIDGDGSLEYQLALGYRQTGQPSKAAAAMARYQALSAEANAGPEPEITPPQ